jgi:hypothetical protein
VSDWCHSLIKYGMKTSRDSLYLAEVIELARFMAASLDVFRSFYASLGIEMVIKPQKRVFQQAIASGGII